MAEFEEVEDLVAQIRSEQQQEIEALRQLNIRMKEHLSKHRLMSLEREKYDDMLDEAEDGLSDKFKEVARINKKLGQLRSDTDWMLALQDMEVAPEVIIKVWDRKDEKAREYLGGEGEYVV